MDLFHMRRNNCGISPSDFGHYLCPVGYIGLLPHWKTFAKVLSVSVRPIAWIPVFQCQGARLCPSISPDDFFALTAMKLGAFSTTRSYTLRAEVLG
jgi:hypothetical protein